MIVQEAKDRGHEVYRISITRLSFIMANGDFKVFFNKKELKGIDACLIRGVSPHFAKAITLAKTLHRQGTRVVDRELYQKVYALNKMFTYSGLSYHGLPCLPSYYFSNNEEFNNYKKKLKFPVLVKDINGMHGRNIFFKYSLKELEDFFNWRKINKYFIQKFVDSEYYYRVLVVGKKVLGAMKRNTLKSIRRKRIPLAKRSHYSKLTRELKRLGKKAAKATNSDIAGVDIIYDGDKPYILEVNRSPQFKRFTQIMQVKVAEEIVKYIEKY
ncbi:hypothetical protein A2533_02565 [Candidatus Falkowbacteria bacterium RIFOXYD2_FULL_35_9]|uniref:ATP-grasp domain-containing protein n=1 Tax=Candidatus Falkowbacteria bacterium RIFOXYC2_FULL_36_12 TaxID=1798002 RepID=A0A1F5T3E1_9BACT|nr:MAG: hypothetical protein A2478_02145 [Candidatus Falkowbacteria bacterium RIFOXYC2_FULL_36_12]OGF34118.1 MAG: hypothetical protein A2223_01655 [Candidatus Falkowbacteria bacterium RIFOXYA2_FULL_35_8]OGF46859.1 MAG: hypothetical protein A2533_02565 [Candidatus Falkowbacteria bacterium RIFOXYD2_FULL_35_9]